MAFVRISYLNPKAGQEERVSALFDELSTFFAAQPGYITGYRLRPYQGDDSRREGRVAAWESEHAAVEAAQSDHVLALRSELILAAVEDSHVELMFEGVPESNA